MTDPGSGSRECYLAVDIGGTFTDIIVARSDGRLHRAKVLSTFGELLNGIDAGLSEILGEEGLSPQTVAKVVHASTVATNTILEQKGALTGLITTRGFRDVLEIGRLRRPSLYDIFWQKPPPLVRRSLRREVTERVTADGRTQVPISLDDVATEIDVLHAKGVESVAVCFLHSYANGAHELAVRDLIRKRYPSTLVSLSHEVLPEIREYERASTTVVNAYILPAVDDYLQRFTAVLRDLALDAPLFMMQSSGGIIPAAVAARRPVSIVESGPAAGALATGFMTLQADLQDAIAFDMGGTTAKACVVQAGVPEMAFEYEVGGGANAASPLLRGGGYALRGPTISVAEVGSGGGSIAWVDEGGAVQVGPESAGANPGPACYGRGGTSPTVTDANVALGYVDPVSIAGGRLSINARLADKALRSQVADRLGLSVHEAAYGIHVIANENMARAVRAVTTERGRDPRDFCLVAFGGSGPVHAAGLARSMGIEKVLVPIVAGLFSALGLLFSDVRNDFVATEMSHLAALEPEILCSRFEALTARAHAEMAAVLEDGPNATHVQCLADMRYVGQSFELSVDAGALDGDVVRRIEENFASAYTRLYGRLGTGPIEVVSIRVAVAAPVKRVSYADLAAANADNESASPQTRLMYFGEDVGLTEATVLRGRQALPQSGLSGPLVIDEADTTIVVPPDFRASVNAISNVVISPL